MRIVKKRTCCNLNKNKNAKMYLTIEQEKDKINMPCVIGHKGWRLLSTAWRLLFQIVLPELNRVHGV